MKIPKIRLKLRLKVFLSVSIFVTSFFLLEIFISQEIFIKSFKDLEKAETVKSTERTKVVFDRQVDNLKVKLTDWSNWDDTYYFIQSKDPKYIESNLQSESLQNLKINSMIFISSTSALVYAKNIDVEKGNDIPLSQELKALIADPKVNNQPSTHSGTSGILRISNGLLFFAANPILTSDASGPSMGTLIFIKNLDKETIEYFEQVNNNNTVDIQDYYSQAIPQDFKAAKERLSENLQYFPQETSPTEIAGYTVVKDYSGKPAYILKTTMKRNIFNYGQSSIINLLIIYLVASILSLVLAIVIIDKFVIKKIVYLQKNLEEVVDPNTKTEYLTLKGNDEFSDLANDINEMFDRIKASSRELQKFKLAIENTSDHVIITDPEGIIIYANKGAERLTGYSFEEMKGNRPSLWGKQMPKEFYEEMWDTIKNKKQPFFAKLTNKNKSGQLYPVESSISPILDKDGNVEFFIGVERDISTEKKLADNLLRQNQEIEQKVELQTKEIKEEQSRLFSILESMPVGVFVLDSKGTPFYVNTEGKKLLGKSLVAVGIQELSQTYGLYRVGTNTLYPAEELPIIMAFHGKTNTVRDIEIRRDDKTIVLEVSSAPIFNSEGDIVFAIAAFKDITEEKTLERSKDEFFSIASHELRTPLTAIRGNTALIKQYYQDSLKNNKDLNEMIDDIHSSSERLIQIVNDFLNVSRLEQGKMEFKLENFDIVELVKNKIEEVASLASQKNLIVAMEESTEVIPTVYADRDKLGEVILNLLGNAINHTDTGKIILKAEISGNFVKVLVSDTGRGISEKYKNLLFKKFQQAGESILTRDTTKGTGLGLYISKLLIEQMGGEIHLESSEENKGSVFSFIVPVAK